MERGLLSDPKLAERYDDVVWMYLFQDFSGSETDRAAERVAIRFGITSWPQHFLVDPYTLTVIGDTGRSLTSFAAAVDRVAVTPRSDGVLPPDLAARDAAAARLEDAAAPLELARRQLANDDVVVRYRAIERLHDDDPAAIAAMATELLAVPHDQTRFAVCRALAKAGADEASATALEQLVLRPRRSKNPNVLRSHAVQALGKCGDLGSVAVVAPHATTGNWRNSTTRVSVACLVAIAAREAAARPVVAAHLCRAFPQPAPDPADAREVRGRTQLARTVHEALEQVTGARVPFPDDFDGAAREALIARWREQLG